ncbi:MAG: ABC transporter ATP-binding protein [Proteobacteria bacterium]|nr:ABC transporter ATP-binding protein [Pseudomonadota bacterium]
MDGSAPTSAKTGATGSALPISIEGIRKTYGSYVALDDVSLDIPSGEFLTLLGPSGSGKTTLLMVLAGFARPDRGITRFGGTDVSLVPPHRRNVGVVFQNYALFPHMSVAGNIAYPLKLRRVSKADIADRVKRALDLVQLGGYGDRRIDQLSGGQRQRVALARAIVFEPRILLMDEPLSALDKNLREQMQIEVRHLHQRLGMTTVYVTHDQREALTMSDRIAVIDKGRFRQIGPPKEIYERPQSRFIASFIGDSQFLPVSVSGGAASFAGKPLVLARPLESAAPDQLLAIRPEKLIVLGPSAASGINVFDGTVKEIVYQGESSLIYVDLAGGWELILRQTTSSAVTMPAVGAPVRLGLAPADVIVVPKDTGA